MRNSRWNRWFLVFGVFVGCNAKLSIDPGAGGAGGGGAVAGGADPVAGSGNANPVAGSGGADPVAGAGGSDPVGGTAGEFMPGGGVAGAPVAGGGGRGQVSGSFNGGGDGGTPGVPGDQGQPCIPGALVDSGSGFGAAKVTTLAHCFAGLSCNAASKCVAMPNCPQATGACLEYDTGIASSYGGDSGNYGGAGNTYGGASATGDPPGSGPSYLQENESGVMAMTTDATHLYWIEYGKRDSIGNFQNNGVLMAMTLADGTTKKLGDSLSGASALGITDSDAFVVTDGGVMPGSLVHLKLLRFPLAGGDSTVIQDGSPPILSSWKPTFAKVGSTAYWVGPGSLYSLPSGATTPTVVATTTADQLHADATNLYFDDRAGHISKTGLADGSAVEPLGIYSFPFDLNGDSIYGLEYTDGGIILNKSAKSNASWLRIRALGEAYPQRLAFAGDRLYAQWSSQSRMGVTSATLSNTTSAPVRVVDSTEGRIKLWAGTPNKLYWTDGARIFSRAVPTP